MSSPTESRHPGDRPGRSGTRRIALGLVLALILLMVAGVLAYVSAEKMTHEVDSRALFHQRIDTTRRLHTSMLQAEYSWHRYMGSGTMTDPAVADLVGQARFRFAALAEAAVGNATMQAYLEDIEPMITSQLATIESTAAERGSMSAEAALDVVARSDREDLTGRIGTTLTLLAVDLEEEWAIADQGVHQAAAILRPAIAVSTILGLGLISAAILFAGRQARRRSRAEAQLQGSEAYNRGLIEASLDAMLTVGQDLVIADVNEAMCRVSGYSREELLGSPFPAYFSDPGRAAAGVRSAFEEGSAVDYELTLRPRIGPEILVSFNAAVYRDPVSGDVLGIIAAARDVTEARRLQRRLADQQAYTRGLIEASVDALATIDLHGLITDVNREMEALTGISREQLIGSPFDELFTDPAAARQGVSRVLAEGRVTDYDLVASGPAGRQTPVSYNATTYFDAEGNLEGVFAAARDVTARERALQQANRSLEAFAYSVSHDLRAPLRALSGFAEALGEDFGPQLGPTGRDYANRVRKASEQMSHLIDALLHLSHLARAELRIERVNLSKIARSVAEDLRREAPHRQVTFEIADEAWAWADARLIRTVLENLLGNAWKFTGSRPRATIRFGVTPADPGWRQFCVQDDGAGFDPAYQNRLFKPFERLHTAAEFPGTGIGLASVARIVERHGGKVWAEGALDQGATFCFTLRAAERSA